jgi:hypothetical protein
MVVKTARRDVEEGKMDLEKAVAYVQSQGDAVKQARLAAILWDEPPPEAALWELAALQKPDGGFAYWMRSRL